MPTLLTLVDVSPVKSFLQIFDKQYILSLSPWERHFMVRGCFEKTQAASRIPPMISRSICKTKEKLLNKADLESESPSISF